MRKNVIRCSALVPALFVLAAQPPLGTGTPDGFIFRFQQSMAEGTTTSEQLTATALDEIDRRSNLNAFISVDAVAAIAQARRLDRQREQQQILGPLHGIPIAVKDNVHVADVPNSSMLLSRGSLKASRRC